MERIVNIITGGLRLNHQITKDKLEVLTSIESKNKNLKKLKKIEKFRFIYGHHYSLSIIKRLLKYKDPSSAFLLYKRCSYLLNDNNDKFTLNNREIKIMKVSSWFFLMIVILAIIISLPSLTDLGKVAFENYTNFLNFSIYTCIINMYRYPYKYFR